MADCLRHELLYSEKRPRDLMFTALAQLVGDNSGAPMILSRLERDATALARELGDASGLKFTNWTTNGKAVVRAMVAAGVFVTPEGGIVAPGVEALAVRVRSLTEGFREITESFLIEFLIRRLGDVTMRDHTALAHALFRQFDPNVSMQDQEDRVAILIARLSDRIELRGQTYHPAAGSVTPA